jgi:hypothetical protein
MVAVLAARHGLFAMRNHRLMPILRVLAAQPPNILMVRCISNNCPVPAMKIIY